MEVIEMNTVAVIRDKQLIRIRQNVELLGDLITGDLKVTRLFSS
jgi:hypothetical protein